MELALLMLGLLPLMLIGDVFIGRPEDDEDDDTSSPETARSPKPEDGADVLQPVTEDETPHDPEDIDPEMVLSPVVDDEVPAEPIWVDPETVVQPSDTSQTVHSDGTHSLLTDLIARDSDFDAGAAWLDAHGPAPDTEGLILDEFGDFFALPENGEGEGKMDVFDGTPIVNTDGTLRIVDGAGGDDTVIGGHEALNAFGGDGDDDLAAGTGASALFGGAGEDKLAAGPAGSFLDGGAGDDTLIGGAGDDRLFGGSHVGEIGLDNSEPDNDVIAGGDGDDFIAGGYGADVLSGDGGDDVIDHLGHAEEQISQEARWFDWHIDGAADVLDGGAGNDTLLMDRHDTATGGEGIDTFWVYFDSQRGVGFAEISDFEVGKDFLRVELNPELDHGAMEVAVTAEGEDGLVLVNGEVIAVLRGAANASLSDVLVQITPNLFAA